MTLVQKPVETIINLSSDGMATATDVAQFLRLARSTVYELMDRGELAYVKFGRSRRIPIKALRQLLDKNSIGGDREGLLSETGSLREDSKRRASSR